MELLEAIKRRRSIRKYQDKEISSAIIKILLEAAMYAPAAGNAKDRHFIIISDKEKLRAMAQLHPTNFMAEKAPVAILVCANSKEEVYPGNFPADCSAATQNILLAATDLGLGNVWVGIYPSVERMESFRKILDMPDFIMPFALVPLGYPAETKQIIDRYDQTKVHTNHW